MAESEFSLKKMNVLSPPLFGGGAIFRGVPPLTNNTTFVSKEKRSMGTKIYNAALARSEGDVQTISTSLIHNEQQSRDDDELTQLDLVHAFVTVGRCSFSDSTTGAHVGLLGPTLSQQTLHSRVLSLKSDSHTTQTLPVPFNGPLSETTPNLPPQSLPVYLY